MNTDNTNDTSTRINPFLYTFWASAFTCIPGFGMYPLRLVKTRMQIDGSNLADLGKAGKAYERTSTAFVHIIKTEGFRGLFSGSSIFVAGLISMRLIQFGSYDMCQNYLGSKFIGHDFLNSTISGGVSGFLTAFTWVPTEVISQHMSVETSITNRPKASVIIRKLFHAEGIRGFYKGFWLSTVGLLPFTSSLFAMFELSKDFLTRALNTDKKNPIVHTLAGCFAGTAATVIYAPIDMVKTRLQIQHKTPGQAKLSTWKIVTNAAKLEGYSAFWKGVVPRIMSLAPIMAFNLAIFEQVRKLSSY
eukprot:TRINITY_DN9472_c0_g1_i2.p1 TRINITY_DN9472_c0_g1~~TRINITY_DN9472_c0_g1_i2.p1  ORF type:complete len:303 (-),score=37.21 TRINITY_DN9472_c0_g1_i2:5-913(-)